MVEFLAIGAHAIRRAKPVHGDRVLVVGAGPIGIGCMLFAGLQDCQVTALDLRQDRLDFCRKRLGVHHTVAAKANVKEALSELTGGDFFDIVIDATGNAKSMMAGLAYVAHGGTYVLVSVVHDTISFADPEFHKRETTLLGSRNATPEDFSKVFDAMREGRVPTDIAHHPPRRARGGARQLSPLDQTRNRRHQGADRDLVRVRIPDPPVRRQPLPAGACRPVRQRGASSRRSDGAHRRGGNHGEPGKPPAHRRLRGRRALPGSRQRPQQRGDRRRKRRGFERRRRRRRR